MDGVCSTHGGDDKCIKHVGRNTSVKRNSETHVYCRGKDNIKCALRKQGVRIWIGLKWFRLLRTRDFSHKRPAIFKLAEQLSAFQE
jgi:hypothetical protein